MAKLADPPPACILVINKHDGPSRFVWEEEPSTGPGTYPVFGSITLVPRINSVDPARIKTDLPMDKFFGANEVVVNPSADILRGMVAGDPNLIDHAQSVPALRLVAAMCPELKDRCDKRIEFFRSGANPNPEPPRAG